MSLQDSNTDSRVLRSDPKLYAILGLAAAGVLSSTLVSPALPGMASAFELTEARVGMVMTAFYLTAVVAIPTVGAAADIWGRRTVFLGSLVVYGIAGVLIAFVDTFAVVLLLRAIQGCAFPGLIPMAITLIGDLYDGTVATTAQGLSHEHDRDRGYRSAAGRGRSRRYLLAATLLAVRRLVRRVRPVLSLASGARFVTERQQLPGAQRVRC